MERMDREPCPYRIVDDAGGAFAFGLVGGGVWHFVGGFRNAPKGQGLRMAGSRAAARAPMLGGLLVVMLPLLKLPIGSFAVWGTLFSCCDCTITYFRKKEDPWNAIWSGAATGGILAARAGLKAAGRSALAGGVILAAIEGLNLALMRVLMPAMEKKQLEAGMEIDRLVPPEDPLRPRLKKRAVQPPPVWDTQRSNPFDLGSSNPFNLSLTPSTASSGTSSSSGNWDAPGFRPEAVNNSTGTEEEKKEGGGGGWRLW